MADPITETEDAPASPDTPYAVAPETAFRGQLGPGDRRDWISFDAEAGTAYAVAAGGIGETPVDAVQVDIYDSDRNLVAEDFEGPSGYGHYSGPYYYYDDAVDGAVELYFPEAGTFHAEVSQLYYDPYDEDAPPQDYELTIAEIDISADVPADSAGAGPLGSDTIVASRIDYRNDLDWFELETVPGVLYDVIVTGTGQEEDLYPSLALVDGEDGLYVARFDATPTGVTARFQGFAEQKVFAEVGAAIDSGPYQIALAEVVLPPDDLPAGPQTEAALDVNASLAGTIDTAGDRDWVRLSLEGGRSYDFAMIRDPDAEDPVGDPQLRLLDAEGAEIAFASGDFLGGEPVARIEFDTDAAAGGTYYLEASATDYGSYDYYYYDYYYYDPEDEAGGYVLIASENPTETADAPADATTPYSTIPGATVRGRVEAPGDTDWFAVEVEAGTHLTVDMAQLGDNGLFDPAFDLVTEQGAVLASADDGASGLDAPLVYAVERDTTLYVAAGSSPAAPDDRGRYTVELATLSPGAVEGGDGNDKLMAAYAAFADMSAGAGHDLMLGDARANLFFGQFGDDVLEGEAGNDILRGGRGEDMLTGGRGRDALYGGGDEDILYGNLGRDLLIGNEGADEMHGNIGADTLRGGDGDDWLIGGRGPDVLNGNGGVNLLRGGPGRDTFVFAEGESTVEDFDPLLDTLRLNGEQLWGGREATVPEIVERYAEIVEGDAVLTFKGGAALTIEGLDDLAVLAAATTFA